MLRARWEMSFEQAYALKQEIEHEAQFVVRTLDSGWNLEQDRRCWYVVVLFFSTSAISGELPSSGSIQYPSNSWRDFSDCLLSGIMVSWGSSKSSR